jgi:hypothetical protein
MTYQPGEQPFAQPQDPWSGTQGMASAPTDPIPATPAERGQQPRGQYTPGVASPSVWVQETVAHSDPYASGARGGGRGGLYVLVALLVVVLGGAGGYGAWWAITNYAGGPANPPATTSTSESTSPTPEPTETAVTVPNFDLVVEGACMINRGSQTDPDMFLVACDWAGDDDIAVVEVLRVERGPGIPENDAGEFDRDSTGVPRCGDLARFDLWYTWDHPNDDFDLLVCLSEDVRAN